MRITDRDIAILKAAWSFQCLTALQISRLFSLSLKVCQRRLRKLVVGRYLDRLLKDEVAVLVAQAFEELPERERAVLGWRLGLPDQEPQTLKEISDRLQVSRERVRQIESMAKSRVRRRLVASLRNVPRRLQ